MDEIKKIQEQLSRPFDREDVEFRINRVSVKKKSVNVLAYVTARGIMQRLDDVFGINGWKDEYEVLDTGVKCKLTVKLGDEWITKEDVGPFTNIEALKGGFSDSLKRAGVKFGIGRYLYDLPDYWVDVFSDKPYNTTNPVHYYKGDDFSGWWMEPDLPESVLASSEPVKTTAKRKETRKESISNKDITKLQQLLEAELITKGKYEQFNNILSQGNVSKSVKDLVSGQIDLIELYGEHIIGHSKMSQADKRDLYKRILNCKQEEIEPMREQILSLREREAA